MNRLRPLARRTSAAVVGALLGLAGAVAVAPPASADHTEVSGTCGWDAEANEWVVTWTVTPGSVDGATAYRLVEATATPEDAAVEGFAVTEDFAHNAGEELAGEQRLLAGEPSASLAVRVEWDNGHVDEVPRLGEVALGTDCAAPDPGTELGQWSFDCNMLTITVDNPTDQDAALTFAPSAGDPVDVELPGGESTTVQFPSGERLSVDVRSGGRSIVDPAEPIEVTPAQWAEQECDDVSSGDGEGGDLAATGSPTRLIIGGAVVLLALGAALYLIARRRRIRFTA